MESPNDPSDESNANDIDVPPVADALEAIEEKELVTDGGQPTRAVDPRDIDPTEYVDAYVIHRVASEHDLSPDSVEVALRRDLAHLAAIADDIRESRRVLAEKDDYIVVLSDDDVLFHSPPAVLSCYRYETARDPADGYALIVPTDVQEQECEHEAEFQTAKELAGDEGGMTLDRARSVARRIQKELATVTQWDHVRVSDDEWERHPRRVNYPNVSEVAGHLAHIVECEHWTVEREIPDTPGHVEPLAVAVVDLGDRGTLRIYSDGVDARDHSAAGGLGADLEPAN